MCIPVHSFLKWKHFKAFLYKKKNNVPMRITCQGQTPSSQCSSITRNQPNYYFSYRKSLKRFRKERQKSLCQACVTGTASDGKLSPIRNKEEETITNPTKTWTWWLRKETACNVKSNKRKNDIHKLTQTDQIPRNRSFRQDLGCLEEHSEDSRENLPSFAVTNLDLPGTWRQFHIETTNQGRDLPLLWTQHRRDVLIGWRNVKKKNNNVVKT